MPLVSIISVNYNQPEATADMLKSVFEVNKYPEFEVIVVDNASSEFDIETWQKKFPSARFIASKKNLGFAGGNNLGLKEARGEYLFLINNDTEVTAGLIEQLVSTMETHPQIGMISPRILSYNKPEEIQYNGYSPMNYYTGRNYVGYSSPKETFVGQTGYAHGAAMMLRREALSKAGLMDESYFLYYEELDWCERIKHAGYEIWINRNATIYHKESLAVGRSSPLKEYYMTRNRILFQRRHAPFLARSFFLVYFLLIVAPRNLVSYLVKGRTELVFPFLKGISWNFVHKKY
ncbi:MAG: glycosyltransferase family 2 protein [Candidatus Dadabacteria bacterium]